MDTVTNAMPAYFVSMPAGSMAALQSGPSRTADIEKTLILGMHGPGATHVILADRPLPEFLDPSPETA